MKVFFGLFDSSGYPAKPDNPHILKGYGLDTGDLTFEDIGLYLPVSNHLDGIDVDTWVQEIDKHKALRTLQKIEDLRPHLIGMSFAAVQGSRRSFSCDLIRDNKFSYATFNTQYQAYDLPRGFTILSMDEHGHLTLSNGQVVDLGKIQIYSNGVNIMDVFDIQ